MEDLGYSCCDNPSALKEVFSEFVGEQQQPLKEYDVALILGMMARTHTGLEGASFPLYNTFPPVASSTSGGDNNNNTESSSLKTWNINTFVEVLREQV